MHAGVPEHPAQQGGRAVHHGGLTVEVGRGGHETGDLDDALDPVQVLDLGLHRGQGVERAAFGELGGPFRGHGPLGAGIAHHAGLE